MGIKVYMVTHINSTHLIYTYYVNNRDTPKNQCILYTYSQSVVTCMQPQLHVSPFSYGWVSMIELSYQLYSQSIAYDYVARRLSLHCGSACTATKTCKYTICHKTLPVENFGRLLLILVDRWLFCMSIKIVGG